MKGTVKPVVLGSIISVLSTILLLAIIEATFRVKVYFDDKNNINAIVETPRTVPRGKNYSLADIIKLSRNRKIIYELSPNIYGYFNNVPIITNMEGFKDKDYPDNKDKKTVRIVGIGDSIMFGWGLQYGKDYLSLLESKLNDSYPEKKWEIINTAVPGYNTVMEVETLKEKGMKYNPDIVIMGFVKNDYDLPNFIRDERNYLSLEKSFLYEFLYKRLINYKSNTGKHQTNASGLKPSPQRGNLKRFIGFQNNPTLVPIQYRDMVGQTAIRNAMKTLKDLATRNNFDVIVVMHGLRLLKEPIKYSLELGFHVITLKKRYQHYMKANNTLRYKGSPLTLSKIDSHPSGLSHAIIAEEIFEYLSNEKLLYKYLQ